MAKATKEDKPEDKKPYTIIDVNHPGKTAAEASGVPVIVTNRPVLKDPMVVDKDESVEESNDDQVAKARSKKIKIQPLDDEPETKPKSPAKDSKKTIAEIAVEADAKAVDKKPKSADKPEPEEPKEPETTEPAESEPDKPAAEETKPEADAEADKTEPEVKATDGQLTTDEDSDEAAEPADPKAAEEARKAAEKQLALDKLATAGTYALPINAVEKRRVKRFALITILLLIILGAVWVDLALDAQLIQINGVNPPTDFFPDR